VMCQRRFAGSRKSRVRAPAASEEHTSELQSPCNLVCRLLLEKKKKRRLLPLQQTENAGGTAGGRSLVPLRSVDDVSQRLRAAQSLLLSRQAVSRSDRSAPQPA